MKPETNMPAAPSLLLRWMACQPPRTVAHIRFACKSLATALGQETETSFYRTFMPLFRLGMVEFTGNGRYQISPTVLIAFSGGQTSAVNPNPIFKEYLKNKYGATELLYNLQTFYCTPSRLKQLARDYQIPVIQPEKSGLLARFPDIGTVVRHWKPVPLIFPIKYFYHPFAYRWSDEPLPFGIFKTSESARTYYFLDQEGRIRPIPSAERNPDAFALAAAWQAALMSRRYIQYNPSASELLISQIRLPAVLERVLRIRELALISAWPINKPETLISHITPSDDQSVRRILCQKN